MLLNNKLILNVMNKHVELRNRLETAISHQPGATTSNRYVAVNTLDVIDNLHSKGFIIDQVSGAFSKNISKVDGKHRVVMMNPDLRIGEDGTCARVVLSNSYDGRSSLRVVAGLFRFACENGMIIGQVGDVSKVANKHVEGIYEALSKVDTYIDKLPQMSQLISGYRDMTIDDELLAKLALEFACTRQEVIWGSKFDRSAFDLDVDSMTEIWRTEDARQDGWTAFNILQEKVIRGGYKYKPFESSGIKLAKAIRNPYTEDKINQQLFHNFHNVLIG